MIFKRWSLGILLLMALAVTVGVKAETEQRLQAELSANLNEILEEGVQARQKLDRLRAERDQLPEGDREEVQERIDTLKNQINKHKALFTKLLSGGSDMQELESIQTEVDFNWQNDLLDIMQPVFAELKKITDTARSEEVLIRQIRAYRANIHTLSDMRNRITLMSPPQDQTILERLEDYDSYLKDLISQHTKSSELLQLQLAQVQANNESWSSGIAHFAAETGMSVLLALLISLAFFSGFIFASKQSEKKAESSFGQLRFQHRLWAIIFKLVALAGGWLVFVLTLYLFQQWLLFGLVALITIFMLFSLKDKIPEHITEVRTMLNLGPIKESERIVFEGIAWRINKIGLLTEIENPSLGAKIWVPLSQLVDRFSRQPKPGEGWYPTKPGDCVLTHDGRFVQVVDQNVEYVELVSAGSGSVVPTTEFPGMIQKNLSDGYLVATDFGLDYNLQSVITSDVLAITQEAFAKRLPEAGFAEHVDNHMIDFGVANASSLDLKILINMKGSGTGDYFAVSRWVQKTMVEICNEHDWGIPFAQMVVHKGEG